VILLGQLVLLGLGLSPKHLTVEALDEIGSADLVFIDTYTGDYQLFLKLIKALNSNVKLLGRSDLEEKSIVIDYGLKYEKVVLAVVGDPLVATTHASLIISALEKGLKVKIVNGVSIFSAAISRSGLMVYRFGKPVTIVYPKNGIVYEYPYHVIKDNMSRGLHTLLLLEYDNEKKIYMTVNDALNILLELEAKIGGGVITGKTIVIGIARLGYNDELIKAGEIEKMVKYDFGPPPHVVIIPAKLHFIEEEILKKMYWLT